jgi:subtilase family serine protease
MTGSDFTVKNQGVAAAGPFRVTVTASPSGQATHFSFAGLDAGQTANGTYSSSCDQTWEARADSLNQVGESNEENNTANFAYMFC